MSGGHRHLIRAPFQTRIVLNFTHASLLLAYKMALALGFWLIILLGIYFALPVLSALQPPFTLYTTLARLDSSPFPQEDVSDYS